MIKKDLVVTAIITFCLTATLFMVVPIRSAQYDPWADLNDDGFIDMMDIRPVASQFGMSGDPTKNVTITGFANTTDVLVWDGLTLDPSSNIYSQKYSADGFSFIKVLAVGVGLVGAETITVTIFGVLYNKYHTAALFVSVYSFTLYPTSYDHDVKIPIPSASFLFKVTTDASSSGGISLSFCRTFA